MIKKTISTILLLSIFSIISMQCSMTTKITIDSQPAGVDVYYRGAPIGKTPATLEMGTSVLAESTLIFKQGDQTIATEKVQRKLSIPMLIFNVFLGWFTLGISWFWVAPPKEYQHFLVGSINTKSSNTGGAVTGFTDTVTLKNGTKYESCSAAVTADSVVITTRTGKTLVYPKSAVESLKKGN
jgi:hypothetical protein